MGGKTAMQLALDFPQRVKKLVVVDIAPRAYPPSHDRILDALLALNLSGLASRQQIEDALAAGIPSLRLRRFLLKSAARDGGGKFFWKMNLLGLAENYDKLRRRRGRGTESTRAPRCSFAAARPIMSARRTKRKSIGNFRRPESKPSPRRATGSMPTRPRNSRGSCWGSCERPYRPFASRYSTAFCSTRSGTSAGGFAPVTADTSRSYCHCRSCCRCASVTGTS